MRWRIPTGLLHACARCVRQDAHGCEPQQPLGDAVADLELATNNEHELDQFVVEEGIDGLDAERGAMAILGAQAARQRLEEDLASLDAVAPSHVVRDPADPVPYTETKGAVLLHVIEELYQHLGQMELTRDVLLAGSA